MDCLISEGPKRSRTVGETDDQGRAAISLRSQNRLKTALGLNLAMLRYLCSVQVSPQGCPGTLCELVGLHPREEVVEEEINAHSQRVASAPKQTERAGRGTDSHGTIYRWVTQDNGLSLSGSQHFICTTGRLITGTVS